MKRIVIILKQNQDRGKTSTLNYLIDLLQGIATAPCLKAQLFPDVDDRAIVLSITGKRVEIVTLGDPDYEVPFQSWLDFCHTNRCNIIVVATRAQLTLNNRKTPYGLIWDFIDKESYYAFETSTYVTKYRPFDLQIKILQNPEIFRNCLRNFP